MLFNKTKQFLLNLSALAAMLVLPLVIATASPGQAYAADDGANQACEALKEFTNDDIDCNTGGTANEVLSKPLTTFINLLTYIVGAVSVVMVIFGGFKFMTSAGDSDATKKARTTVIYALVGLALVLLAQFIIRLAFSAASSVG